MRWQVMFLGKPTGVIIEDGASALPHEPGFDSQTIGSLVAISVGVSLGGFGTIQLALTFFNYGYNYIGK